MSGRPRLADPELCRHPDERRARERLRNLPGFAKGMDMLAESGLGQAQRRAETASMIRVGPGVHPRIHELWTAALDRFGLDYSPLQIALGPPQPWAFRGDAPQALILDAALLETLAEPAMAALLSMRAGDLQLGNAGWLAAADSLSWLRNFTGLAGLPVAMLSWWLESWRHAALFSADRAAALALGGPEAVADLLGRLAGAGSRAWGGVTDPDALRLQGLEALSLRDDWSNSRPQRFAVAMNRQNHAALIRRLDLLSWFAGGAPARLLAGEPPGPEAKEAGTEAPGPALWGAFAGPPDEAEPPEDGFGRSLSELAEAAEKGWGAVLQAGEAVWRSFGLDERFPGRSGGPDRRP